MDNQTPIEGTQEVSIEDRVAGFLGQDEQPEQPEAGPPENQETVEETFEFDAGDRKYVLPKTLEKAVMQEKDYTQKSQSLAEMRKDVERQFAQIKLAQRESQFQQSIASETQQLQMIDAVLQEFGKLKWQEMTTDELVRKKLEMDQYKDMREALNEGVKAKRAQFDQTIKTELEKLKSEANDTLRKRINWSDETEAEVRSYVKELGITDAEYEGVFDPRHKQILWEASQYRKAKAGAQPAVAAAKNVKTNSSNPMPQQVKAKLNFRKAVQSTENNPVARRMAVESRVEELFRTR